MGWLQDETGLDRCAANHVPLTPLSHLNRAAQVWPTREALVYGELRWTYRQYRERVTRLASMLAARGIRPGDVVATLLPNVPAQVEASFGVPACGAVLNTINTRLDVDTVGYILAHGSAKLILVDSQFLKLAEAAGALCDAPPAIVEVPDAGHPASGRHPVYEDELIRADPGFDWILPQDEWESIALNYTSGTTGRPKGVVYHHRGAYLITMGTVVSWRMVLYPRLMVVVPLFHCNGWCHAWMTPLVGGTVVCLRDVTAPAIYAALADEGVTHFGGAPIVLNALVNAPAGERRDFPQHVEVYTAGAPPPAATLARMEAMGFNVTHVYGLTETYGHVVENVWQPGDWDALAPPEKAAMKARQGVAYPMMEGLEVFGEDGAPVPADGTTQGEIAMRGNAVMKGYLKNPEATAEALAGGWFRSGDLGVRHPDGYVQIRDRAKDIIISGGENVSSVEVEGAIMHHDAVSLCAVVARPDARWGEVPHAFVELRDGASATEAEIVAHVRGRLAGFKTPKGVTFGPLPKTSTGKIQKFVLRDRLRGEGPGDG